MLKRVGWFVTLWCVGVLSVGALSLLIRWALLQ